jgi:hypothetical protein
VHAEAEAKGLTLTIEVLVKRVVDKKTGKWHGRILSFQEE